MKLRRFVSILFTLCIFGYLEGVEWSEPTCICDTISSQPPVITIANDGIAWVVESPEIPQVFRFLDEQTGWQKVTECSLGTYSFGGNACFDKDDRLWVLTDDMDDVLYNCYYAGNWGGVHTVPTYPSWTGFTRITVDSSGGVWVGWSTNWWGYWAVAYNRYEDGSWGEPKPVTDTFEFVDHELWSMTTDAYGRVWFGWRNEPDPERHHCSPVKAVYYDGNTWSEEFTLYAQDSTWASGLNLAPDRDGGVWALWSSRNFELQRDSFFVQASYWNGESWSPVDTIAEAGDLIGFPDGKITVDGNGNAWAVWRQALEDNDKYGDIYYSVNTGSGWSEPAPVNTHPAVDRYPDIAVDGAGRVWCVWSSNREGEDQWDYSIWASYATGVGVKEPATPVTPVTQHLPSLTIDKSVGGEFTFSVSHSNIVRGIVIYDASGRVVRDLTISDNQTIHWDGTDAKGQALSPGVYFVKLSPTSSTLKLILIR